jgi:hypothetical protein
MESLKLRRLSRRGLGLATLGGLGYLAASRMGLADGEPAKDAQGKPMCLIVVWLAGGPSQIETFDPKPGRRIGGPTQAIKTSAKGVQIAEGLPLVAAQMQHLSLVRSLVGEEGDHERASILMKTGRRPEPVLTHPSLGAVCAHELPEAHTEIPRYVSMLGFERTSRGGYLGQAYDPFRTGDPRFPVQDVSAPVGEDRQKGRLDSLELLERRFEDGYVEVERHTHHRDRTRRALRMMASPQLDAFKVDDEPSAVTSAYGDTAVGRACLAARRLVEVGVRCVEVNHGGWDTHIDNFENVQRLNRELDPALAALVADLRERDLWSSTLVVCTGEFGRTPKINPADGRDHWPTGFSLAVGGGPIRGGQVIGETPPDVSDKPADPVSVQDVYATILTGLGIPPDTENMTDVGRPVKLSEGKALKQLLG